MGKIESSIAAYKDEGLWGLAVEIWIHIFMRSPLSNILYSILPGALFEKLLMAPQLGYWSKIVEPRSFNEKVVHRKLFSENDLFPKVADKWAVRDYVAEKSNCDVLNEVYYVTDEPRSIPFESLPDEFVLKPTHLSGRINIVDDKQTENLDEIVSECEQWLSKTYRKTWNEDWYREIEPKIIVENRMRSEKYDAPPDYKFFVFNGQVEYIQVDVGRFENHKRIFYDKDWEAQEFRLTYPLAPEIEEPEQLDKMINVAEQLGHDFDFVRIDLFQPDSEKVVFGEITLAPGSGREEFIPTSADFELGSSWLMSE
ncbi:ATP-grasp fold amidoligase family protein [Haloglomus salinum]|uniref:ATP-grasp fold amidoligase family protein n=1 Tax=Haloglomus salinum TaxID=2962673 RepID=UPI0020C95DAE|nr:ATP-grasp fold amidoligase family protein [Haloglomus salinum]